MPRYNENAFDSTILKEPEKCSTVRSWSFLLFALTVHMDGRLSLVHDIPLEIWQSEIMTRLDIPSLCVLRELDTRLVAPATISLQQWCRIRPEWIQTAQQRVLNTIRKGYQRTGGPGLRRPIRYMLQKLVTQGALSLLAWLGDRGWPLACLVWTTDAPEAYWIYEPQVFAAIDNRNPKDWVRRHFRQMLRECYYAHLLDEFDLIGDSAGYAHYCLMGHVRQTPLSLSHRRIWFEKFNQFTDAYQIHRISNVSYKRESTDTKKHQRLAPPDAATQC